MRSHPLRLLERQIFGLNGHWAWLVATIALLLPAVARSVNLPSVRFLRPRTGALDPLQSLRRRSPMTAWHR